MRVEIKDLHRALGITFIYVTHDRHEALAMSDRVVVMRAGAIEQIGTPRDVYESPASHHVARFMGHGNILPATVISAADGCVTLRVAGGPSVEARGPSGLRAGMPVDLVVRGDSLDVKMSPAAATEHEIAAEVRNVLYNGSFLDVHLQLADGTSLRAELRNDGRLEVGAGTRLLLAIRTHGTWVLPRPQGS
jgi:ABC-type Fe3+/spermidine/putrescine transport system ATPase subunit